jgi:hypothetical protein
VLGEAPNALELAGSAVLVAGVALPTVVGLVTRRRRRSATVSHAPVPEPERLPEPAA